MKNNDIKRYLEVIFHDFVPGLSITAFLAFAYMLNLLWIISYDVKLPALDAFLSLYIAIYVSFFVILNLTSSFASRLLILTARCFNRTASFTQTRLAILYALMALLPINVMSCVLQFTFKQPNPNEWITLKLIAYVVSIVALFCSLGLLIRNIALALKNK